jgi:hypothetical protein
MGRMLGPMELKANLLRLMAALAMPRLETAA